MMEVVTGCMFSGKSDLLIARIEQARGEHRRVAAFKHGSDKRFSARHIVAHNGRRVPALALSDASRIPEFAGDAELIVIDEAQFFGPELVEICRELAAGGKDVILAGLDLDSWGLPFGPMSDLMRIADRVIRLRAVCARCGKPADRTQRLAPVAGQKMVGGAASYEPRCVGCFVAPPMELRC